MIDKPTIKLCQKKLHKERDTWEKFWRKGKGFLREKAKEGKYFL